MTINRFFTTSLISVMAVLYAVFMGYFLLDQQRKTDLVLDNIRQDLTETAYIISSQLDDINNITHFKSLLIRKVLNANTFSAITVVKNNQLLLSTTPTITSAPTPTELQNLHFPKTTADLLNQTMFEAKVHFFVQDQPKVLSLFFYSDQPFFHEYFQEIRNRFFARIQVITAISKLRCK